MSSQDLLKEGNDVELEEECSQRNTITMVNTLSKIQPVQQGSMKTMEQVNTRKRKLSISTRVDPILIRKREFQTIPCLTDKLFTPSSEENLQPIEVSSDDSDLSTDSEDGAYSVENTRRIVSPVSVGNSDIEINIDCITIGDLVGEGAYAQVSQGWYRRSKNIPPIQVAVKVEPIKTKSSQDDLRTEKQIKKEVERCMKLDHPNIIRYYGCFFTKERVERLLNGLPIKGSEEEFVSKIVMEYCEKKDLYNLITTAYNYKGLPDKIKFGFLMGIARGIQYLHKNRMVHRDIKLQNILITEDYEVKICDFGSSKAMQSYVHYDQSMRGTIGYIDPTLGGGNGPRNSRLLDIYSFGIMMWSIWVGEHPYLEYTQGKTIVEQPEMICEAEADEEAKVIQQYLKPKDIQKRKVKICPIELFSKIKFEHIRPNPDLIDKAPKGYIDLMKRCWSANFKRRPQSMSEIVIEFEEMSKEFK